MKVCLLHWNENEAASYLDLLTGAGFKVEYDANVESTLMKKWRDDPPAAFVIDLSRLPSRGREIAIALRQSKKTRQVPIVFCGGAAEKVESIRRLLPDAGYSTLSELVQTLKKARPVSDPVCPPDIMNRYEAKTTAEKLGIRPGSRVTFINAPQDVRRVIAGLPEDADVVAEGGAVTICFVTSVDELRADMTRLRGWASETKLWFLWKKKAANRTQEVSERVVRETGIDLGLVDYKICSVNESWSAMLFAQRTRLKE